MKKLPLNEPLLLVLVGHPGSGKSHFARELSTRYSFSVISANKIRSILYDQPAYSSAEEEQVRDIAAYQLEELLKTNQPIIFDADTAKTNRIALVKEGRQAGYRVLTIWLQTDAETAMLRSCKRPPEAKKGAAQQLNIPEALFEKLCKQFSPPTPAEQYVVISGKHTYTTQAHTLLRKLKVIAEPPKSKNVPISAPRPTQPVYSDVPNERRTDQPRRPKINLSRRLHIR